MAREEVHTTFMGNGVAFPHARTELTDEIVLGIGRSAAGVPFRRERRTGAPDFRHRRAETDGDRLSGLRGRVGAADERCEIAPALMEAESAAELVELLRAGSLQLE